MKKSLAFSLVLALVALVPASLALAASMPKPSNKTVVPPTSIAGIKLGMSEAKAKAAWGSGRGKCASSEADGVIRCEYGSEKGRSGRAYFEAFEGKVTTIGVYGGKNAKNEYLASAASALTQLKTVSGIGIGSPYSKLKSAYPKGEVLGKTSEPVFVYSIPGKVGTLFSYSLTGGEVYAFFLSYAG
jgi:hypothetical protein